MDRRDFMGKAGCAAAALVAAGEIDCGSGEGRPRRPAASAPAGQGASGTASRSRSSKPGADSWCHKKGDKFAYPADWGKLCPWLRASLNEFVRLLENGVTLPWRYEGTPYEKVIDPDGVTTEYVRCPDPTSALVAKITRTRV